MSASFAPALNAIAAGVVGWLGAGVTPGELSTVPEDVVGSPVGAVVVLGVLVVDVAALAASARFSANQVGHVGSSGECRRFSGVVENRVLRSTFSLVFLSALAHAVQFEVIKPCILHLSAG